MDTKTTPETDTYSHIANKINEYKSTIEAQEIEIEKHKTLISTLQDRCINITEQYSGLNLKYNELVERFVDLMGDEDDNTDELNATIDQLLSKVDDLTEYVPVKDIRERLKELGFDITSVKLKKILVKRNYKFKRLSTGNAIMGCRLNKDNKDNK